MLDATRHRGPDGEGTLDWPTGAAGMVRLALVDLSSAGQQPLWSDDRRVAIVFNGEFYEFRQERARLESLGHRFRSHTDTEVVLRLYLEHGDDFVSRLRGMFALAIVDFRPDAERPRVLLARDPFGIKPLYLTRLRDGSHAFASELRGLLATGLIELEPDRTALAAYLAHGFVPQPKTLLSNVRVMDAGTLEVFEPDGRHRRERFYQLPPFAPEPVSLHEAARRLRETLEGSVAVHALADAPVGAFLSGGIDSTAIVGLMRRHVASLRTYTLRFPELPGRDEADLASSTAARLDCVHTTVDVSFEDVRASFPRFLRALDQPSVDGFNTWLVSRAAAQHVKGVLSGLGADELFGGYPTSRRIAMLTGTRRGRALRVLARGVSRIPLAHTRIDSLGARRTPLALWDHAHSAFGRRVAARLAGVPLTDAEHDLGALLDRATPDWALEPAVENAAVLDIGRYMQSQLLRDSDALSMAHSLELRVPFVDRELVAFARACATAWKITPRGATSSEYGASGAKRVLVDAVRDLLPDDVLRRPKRGFALPYQAWLDGPLRDLRDDALSKLKARDLLDPRAWDRHVPPSPAYPAVWSLVVLEGCLSSMAEARHQH